MLYLTEALKLVQVQFYLNYVEFLKTLLLRLLKLGALNYLLKQ